MSNRLLIISFVVILIIAGVEAYFLFVNSTDKSSNPAPQTGIPSRQIDNQSSNGTSRVNGMIFPYLRSFNPAVLSSAIVSSEYNALVSDVLSKPGVQGSIQYEEGLILTTQENPKIENYLLIRKSDLAKTKVYGKAGNQIKFADLKKGDTIKIEEEIDLLVPAFDSRISLNIYKL